MLVVELSKEDEKMKAQIICGFVGLLMLQFCSAEPTASAVVVTSERSRTTRIPKYLVYRHFLGWMNAAEKDAEAQSARSTFTESLAKRTGLETPKLEFLREEAKSLEQDLSVQDARASVVINAYRAKARIAVQLGNRLPPIPTEIDQLERERTAVLVQHYVKIQSTLGSTASTRLDNYLETGFAPHISIKPIAAPRPIVAGDPKFPGFAEQPR